MNGALLLALSPWLGFAFASRTGGLDLRSSALLAVGWSIAVLLYSHRRAGVVRAFELETTALFTLLAIASYVLPATVVKGMSPYARAVAVAGFALLALCSLSVRPFTEEYLRDMVPRDELESITFARTNNALTVAWIVTAMTLVVVFVLGALVPGALGSTLLNWVVPLLLVLGCLRYSTSRWGAEIEESDVARTSLDAALDMSVGRPAGPMSGREGSAHLRLVMRPSRPRR